MLSNGLRLIEMLGLGECILHRDGCKSVGAGGLIVAGCTVASTIVQISAPRNVNILPYMAEGTLKI